MKLEKKKPGRKAGWKAPKKRIKSTVFLWPECWAALDKIGPSRGKAIEKLLAKIPHIKKFR